MSTRTAEGRIRTTEWEDVQYKFGNAVGQYFDEAQERKILEQKAREANPANPCPVFNPLAEKAEARDEAQNSDDEDDDALAAFRKQRRAEIESTSKTPQFGVVKHISAESYVAEVTEASLRSWVILLMMELKHTKCEQLLAVFHTLSAKYRDVKFVTIKSTDAVKNFPISELPCVLLYHKQSLHKQLIGLEPWGGRNVTSETAIMALQLEGVLPVGEEEVLAALGGEGDDGEDYSTRGRFLKKF